MATSLRKRAAAAEFNSLCENGLTPEAIALAVMRGEDIVNPATGRKVKVTDRMYQAARDLLNFRLPRLNSIDAVTRNVGMTHEDWVRELDGETGEEEETLN